MFLAGACEGDEASTPAEQAEATSTEPGGRPSAGEELAATGSEIAGRGQWRRSQTQRRLSVAFSEAVAEP